MSKLTFLTQCLGCGDRHLGVVCKKPSFITPTVIKVRCDECESSTILKVSLPRDRTDRNQIAYQAMAIVPSPKLIHMIEVRKELEAQDLATKVSESSVEPQQVAVSDSISEETISAT